MTDTDNNFRSYSEKSKAKRALAKLLGDKADQYVNALLVLRDVGNGETKWGFYQSEVNIVLEGAPEADAEPTPVAAEVDTEVATATEPEPEPDTDPVAAAGAFGALAAAVTSSANNNTAAVKQNREASRNSYTIEKNRPEQNGVKRPSAGGLCRAVWDALDDLREKTGATPTAVDVKALAEANNWNRNNAMIEFYQWRKFNGIFGRQAKPKTAVQAAAPTATEVATETA